MLTTSKRITTALTCGFVLPLLFLAVIVSSTSLLMAQPPGTFTPTGSMTTPRSSHTATLLADGRVLIAGGSNLLYGKLALTRSAELYDPSTGAFTATGNMTRTRLSQTATLLPDGKVLIAGGLNQDQSFLPMNPSPTAELYDPQTGTFTPTSDMTVARYGHVAALLANGKVLIAGGIDSEGYPDVCPRGYGRDCAFAELYDPDTGIFTAIGDMTVIGGYPRTATLLPDGRVLIAINPGTAQLYDPHTGTFSATGDMTVVRLAPTATLLPDGKVLIAGGLLSPGAGGESYPLATSELFDPATGTFAVTGSMPAGRTAHTSTLLPDGTVLIAGGHVNGPPTDEDLVYHPLAGTFSSTGDMATSRCWHTATLLNDGSVLIAGGNAHYSSACIPIVLDSAELRRPALLVPPPALLSLSGDGRGEGAIQHAGTYQLVSPSNPATAGEALIIYCTGLADGSVIPPQVAIGGRMAEVLWFGKTPGFAALNQINVRVPSDIAPGPAVPVRLNYLGRPSNEVTIGVR
jgi:hypothetical protein